MEMSEQDAVNKRRTEVDMKEVGEEGQGGYDERDEEVEGKEKEEEVKEEEEKKEKRPRWPPREDVLPDIEMSMKARIRLAAKKLMQDFEIEGEQYEKQIMNSIAKGMSREGMKVFQPKKKLLLRSMGRGSFFAEEDRFYESSEDETSGGSKVSEDSIDFFEDVEDRTNTSEKPECMEGFASEELSTEEMKIYLSSTRIEEGSDNPNRSELTIISEGPIEMTGGTIFSSANEQIMEEDEIQNDSSMGDSYEREDKSNDELLKKEISIKKESEQEHELHVVNTDVEDFTVEQMMGEQFEEEDVARELHKERGLRLEERGRAEEVGEEEELVEEREVREEERSGAGNGGSTAYPDTTTRSTLIPSNSMGEEAQAEHLNEGEAFKAPRRYPYTRAGATPWETGNTSESSFWDKYTKSSDSKQKKEKRRISWITLVCSGQTVREELGYTAGWTEYGEDELSPAGRAASEAAGEELLRRGCKFDLVLTSSLATDRQATDRLLYSAGQDSIRRYTTWELNPRHLGDLEGTTEAGSASRWGWLSGEVWAHLGPPRMTETHPDWYRQAEGPRQTGESILHLQARTKRIWEFTEKELRKGKRSVLLVCQKQVACALLLHALGLQPTDLSEWSPSPAVPILFSWELKGWDMGLAAVELLAKDTRAQCVRLFKAMLERYVDYGILDKYAMAELKKRYENERKLPTIDDIYRFKRAEAQRLFESRAEELGDQNRLLERLWGWWRPQGGTLAERVYERLEKGAAVQG